MQKEAIILRSFQTMHRQHEQALHKKCMREARKQIKYVNILSNYKRVIICRNVNKKTCKIKSHALKLHKILYKAT